MSYQQALSDFILHDNSSGLTGLFDETADLTIASIYKNGFFRSCREVLVSTFPSAQSFAGEDFFKSITQAFIKEHPPKTATLTGYGKQFPKWLSEQSIDQKQVLSQLAKLDWSWIACLHGNNATPLTAEVFQTYIINDDVDSALPKISALPNIQLQQSSTKIWNLWLGFKKQDQQHESAIQEVVKEPQFIIMWRPNMEVYARALSAEESYFIGEIAHGNLNKASEHVLNKYPGFNLPEQFSALLNHGLLSINE